MRSSIETPILSTSHVGSDPSRLEPLRPVPHANCGFTELRTTRIHKPPGRGWQFNIDDAPLADAEEAPAHAWTWTPGFYAGEVTGELLTADGYIAGTYLFDVSPDPAKLGGDLFAEMIREVWDEDPVLILGSEPAQTLAGDLGGSGDPLIGFARLRRYGPAFVRALHEISSRPIQTAHQVRQQVPIHAAKRADRQTALGTLHNTTALRILTGAVDTGSAGIGSGTVLDVPVSESHFDGAANRCVTSLALAVARQTSEIHQALGRLSQNEEPSDTRTALAPRWPARARFLLWLVDQLNGVLAHSPFSAVSRPEVTAAGLNAAAAHPLYSRAHSLAWRALRHGAAGRPADERLWISPTWEIYERWCFVRLATILRTTRSELRWERVNSHASGARTAWLGRGKGTALELMLQPVFSAWDQQRTRPWRSLSGQLIPDLVLLRHGERTRFVVLDAKYSVDRSWVLKAMRSAHVYHDSLRYGQTPAERSLLLLPAPSGAPWLETPTFHHEHGVGAATLGLDCPTALVDLMRDF